MEIVYFFFLKTEAQKKLEDIKRLRERMKEVASDAKTKEDLYKQLVGFVKH